METPCREYQGARSQKGYGIRGAAKERFGTILVHRQVMIMAGHDIEGKIVMHLCDNPACFRYDHLRIGTLTDNNRDRDAKGRNNNASKTHCKHGHEFTEENTRIQTGSNGNPFRVCRICSREGFLRFQAKRRVG
jgi:hypothetical protein